MSKPTRRLGRGLASLVSGDDLDSTLSPQIQPGETGKHAISRRVPRESVETLVVRTEALEPNPFQPRSSTKPENVLQLADSLRETGMLQPIVARRVGMRLEIVAGERRWRAAQAAGLERVPVLVRDASDEQMLEMALVENIQREDIGAIDRARAYRRLCDEFGRSPEEVGRRVGEDRTTVTNYLRLLELPDEVKELVSSGGISAGHARCLLGIESPQRRLELARSAATHQLSVRAMEEIVRREKSERKRAVTMAPPPGKSAHMLDLERQFEAALGTKVAIKPGRGQGRGRIIIEYNSLDEFDRIAAGLGVTLD